MDASITTDEVASLIEQSERLLFVTGAGISADSGLPTYRGVGGLYRDSDTVDGIPIETALSGSMFATRPEVSWRYLWEIGSACAKAKPNVAHLAIAEIERRKSDVWVITQNVDGLHRAAGSRQLVEVHGYAYDLYCVSCGKNCSAAPLIARYQSPVELPPLCTECSGIVRPRVVLFDEEIPFPAQQQLRRLTETHFDLIVFVGTTALFPYIFQFILRAAKRHIPCIEINPAETPFSKAFSHRLQMSSAEAFAAIGARLGI